MRDYGIANLDFKRVAGGLLVESLDDLGLDRGRLQVVTQRRPTLEELTDLLFAWRAVRHVRSNAIVLARNGATVGIGAAQASRQVSVEIALRRAGDRAKLAVMASDAYFPFPDGIQAAAEAGVTAIIQPGGSIRDEMAIEVADRHHLAMVFTGRRHFRALIGRAHRRPDVRWNSSSRSRWSASPKRRRSPPRARMGRGDRDGADQAATEAMRRTMDEIDFAGRIVIGEGERDEAPMLYIGEEVGRRGSRADVPRDRHRRRPARGHEPRRPRPGRRDHRPRRLGGGRPDSTPPTPTWRSCASGRSWPARSTSARRPTENLGRIAEALGRRVRDITVVILERPRHDALIAEVREAGARIKLISDGDLSAAISCAVSGTGVHAVMGIGGAPEGVITAAALRCLGGEIQARFRYRNDEERARGARMGHGDEDRVYHDRGPRPRREPGLRGDRRHDRRPAPGRPLLRRRRPDALAGDGLPDQAGPLRRHGPHVRPRLAAAGPPLGAVARSGRSTGRASAEPELRQDLACRRPR